MGPNLNRTMDISLSQGTAHEGFSALGPCSSVAREHRNVPSGLLLLENGEIHCRARHHEGNLPYSWNPDISPATRESLLIEGEFLAKNPVIHLCLFRKTEA